MPLSTIPMPLPHGMTQQEIASVSVGLAVLRETAADIPSLRVLAMMRMSTTCDCKRWVVPLSSPTASCPAAVMLALSVSFWNPFSRGKR